MRNIGAFLHLADPRNKPRPERVEPELVLVPKANEVEVVAINTSKIGDPSLWLTICKVKDAANGSVKETKAMTAGTGCLVQVSSSQRNKDGTYQIAEAVTYVPNVTIIKDIDGGHRLHQTSPFG